MRAMVAIESVKNAEKKGGCGRAYLARLTAGVRGSVDREFAPKEKELNQRNRRAFRLNGRPGDVFEARRWWWDGERGNYVGGTVWFGLQGDGSIFPLTRDEAFAAVHAPRIEAAETLNTAPAIERASRIAPAGVFSRLVADPVLVEEA